MSRSSLSAWVTKYEKKPAKDDDDAPTVEPAEPAKKSSPLDDDAVKAAVAKLVQP